MPTIASHVFKPSSARRVQLDSFIPVTRGATAIAPPPLAWPAKDPRDVLDYQLDIGSAVAGNDGDVIGAMDIAISPSLPGDLTLVSSQADGSCAVLWLAGGQANTVYTVTATIGTVSGRNIQRSVLLPVLPLSNLAVPATALLTDAGLVITDQNGNPVLS